MQGWCAAPSTLLHTNDPGQRTEARYAAPGLLAGLLSTAGLQEAREQEIVVEPKIKTGVPFWAPLLEMNAAHIWSGLTPQETEEGPPSCGKGLRAIPRRRTLPAEDPHQAHLWVAARAKRLNL